MPLISDMDDGKVLSIEQAQEIFNKMKSYPNYKIYVAEANSEIVGTFALAIMDNLSEIVGTFALAIMDNLAYSAICIAKQTRLLSPNVVKLSYNILTYTLFCRI